MTASDAKSVEGCWPATVVDLYALERHLTAPGLLHRHPDYLALAGSSGWSFCGEWCVDVPALPTAGRIRSQLEGIDFTALPECETCAVCAMAVVGPRLHADLERLRGAA